MTSTDAELHPDVAPLAFLIGRWEGGGHGDYPTTSRFEYTEEIEIAHMGKPFLEYRQRTHRVSDGFPLHSEVGFFRGAPGGRVELVLAHPTGVAEVEEGTVSGTHLELVTTNVGLTSTAKEVTALRRVIDVEAGVETDVLRYRLDMAAMGEPLTFHLSAELVRITD